MRNDLFDFNSLHATALLLISEHTGVLTQSNFKRKLLDEHGMEHVATTNSLLNPSDGNRNEAEWLNEVEAFKYRSIMESVL